MTGAIGAATAGLGEHVTYGPGAVRQLPAILRRLSARRVLLVCGRRSFEASGAAEILPDLRAGAEVRRFSDFSPNTDVEDLAAGLDAVRDLGPDLVLGIGGGSALDLAKLLGAYATTREDPITAVRAGARVETRDPRLVLVPTTSGSGSEATHFAVVYVGHDKHSVAGAGLVPDHVVLDPELSRSGSPHQRASSGIDAVCQAIESRWATAATPTSREHARRGLALLLDHLEAFVHDPAPAAAEGMCLGSHLAGRAIDVSRTTAAHALSYGITMRHGVSHGHAVAVTLGPFLETHARATPEDLRPEVDPDEHARAVREVLAALGVHDPAGARRRFVSLLERIGLEPRLSRLGVVDQDERAVLAARANPERLGNDPLRLDDAGLRSILAAAG